ncbi:MAG: hypothetical protein PHR25_02695 [Clostridia bacterium]|nr:hypothetical protein [Clostridia bacterium]MDD4375668.1 hypothetical protein [Clostridia bacterium]
MEYVPILFLISGIIDILDSKMKESKKTMVVYIIIMIISVFLTLIYYNADYKDSIISFFSNKIRFEDLIWIK